MPANTKQITRAIKLVAPKSGTLPSTEGVHFTGTHIVATDLSIRLRIPFNVEQPFVANAQQVCDVFDAFGVNFIPQVGAQKIQFVSGRREIKMNHWCEIDDFPAAKEFETDWKHVTTISEEDVAGLAVADDFTSGDELRAALCRVWLTGNRTMASDSHTLVWLYRHDEASEDLPISSKAIALMNIFEGTWIASVNSSVIRLSNTDGVSIEIEKVDGNRPNFDAVIPKDNPIKLCCSRKELLEAIRQGSKFAGERDMVLFHVSDTGVKLTFEDLDYEREFSTELVVWSANEDIEIGFNFNYLKRVLKHCSEDVEILMSAPNRAAIVNGNFLIMTTLLRV